MEKNKHAQALGRKGGLKTAEKGKEYMSKLAKRMWKKRRAKKI